MILIHGGPIPQLGAKNMGVFLSYGELIAASGLVAVTFDHRFLGPARLQEAASDVADLVSHVRANASSLGIDPERIALWAFSGGGPFLSSALRDRPGWLKAVAAFYAVLDLQPVFIERHQRLGQRFEAAPTDSHWNALAHRLVAEELRKTPVWRRLFDTAAAELLPVKLHP